MVARTVERGSGAIMVVNWLVTLARALEVVADVESKIVNAVDNAGEVIGIAVELSWVIRVDTTVEFGTALSQTISKADSLAHPCRLHEMLTVMCLGDPMCCLKSLESQ